MYKKSSFLSSLILIASVTTLVDCQNLPSPPKQGGILKPPNEPAVAKSIAISSFDGKDGDTFRSELQAMLTPLFIVKTSPQKAEGVFSGRVIQSSVEKKYACRFSLSGIGLCKPSSKDYCLRSVATFEVFLEVKKPGEVIYSKNVMGREIGIDCIDVSTIALDSELLRKARMRALWKIRKDVAVYDPSDDPSKILFDLFDAHYPIPIPGL